MSERYNTKLTVEIDINTQFGPDTAICVLQSLLCPIRAVEKVKLIAAESDIVFGPETNKELNVNYLALQNLPRQLK
jgi:hypothetical protein